ncbi:diacylglycerol/lipid kinase family protein [Ruania albidiflava]|uniref:diacylglycerol/lipid kinase family protein n=1 Tax=Ruania albidiflava TaxID=366586 RepID=UPI0023F16758|nr:diacylglycerol kinase family protein [Ruania albidiflava]
MRKVRAAVVYHPMKLASPRWRRMLRREEQRTGRPESLWVPTRADDDADTLHHRLREAGAVDSDVLIAAGGDGTVRLVAEAAMRTGQSLGIWPVGSTNLFARNLELPTLDPAASLRAGLGGTERMVDTMAVTAVLADGSRIHHTGLVLAGFGVDAQMVVHTSDEAKRQFGWLAYLHGVRKGISRPDRFDVTYSVDGSTPQDARLFTLAVGNGGLLPAGLVLLPDAQVDDGLLDVLLLRPDGARGWRDVGSWFLQENGLVRRVMRRRGKRRPLRTGPSVQLVEAREVRLQLRRPEDFQLDGEYLGRAVAVRAQVSHGSLRVRVP